MKILAIALAAASLAGCATSQAGQPAVFGRADLRDGAGNSVGTAQLYPTTDGKVGLQLRVSGLASGRVHGAHLHMVGRCERPDFTTAGSHLNPGGRQHGADNPAGSHLGDLPNVVIGQDGTANMNATIPGEPAAVMLSLFDGDGTAIVLHANPDDYRTDPSGNSGARIVCGAFARPG